MATVAGKSGGVHAVKELTLRGIILGALITVVFTAANVYLGLKIGITFATSIPAAVISMAVLKAFRDATVLDQVMVGTVQARWRLKYLGRIIEDCVVLTDVWVRDDGQWRAIRRHSTPAPANFA